MNLFHEQKTTQGATEFLRPYDPSIRELALALRELVIDDMAPCHESIYDAYNAVAIGYGPSERLMVT